MLVASLAAAGALVSCTAGPAPPTAPAPHASAAPTSPPTMAPTMSATARKYLDAALDVIEVHAVNRARLNWPAIRQQALRSASAAFTPTDTYSAIAVVLGQLGVNGHSRLIPLEQKTALLPLSPSQLPSGRRLPGRIGYIALPGINEAYTDPYLAAGTAVMRNLLARHPGGWIIDLRSDDGGDVWPMLGAVQPLLGSGTIGSFVAPSVPASVVRVSSTEITQGDEVSIRMSAAPQQSASTDPVVILTGPTTGSSGEFAAIVFRGRPCTTSMGSATFGLPTSNQEYLLSDGADLYLTTAFESDRTGHVYPDAPIQPDVQAGTANYFATWRPTDPAIQAASRWLTLHHSCGS
jgi:carboxyl-terminal processing protease